jgi:FtsZ-binding cell division protein ZapB
MTAAINIDQFRQALSDVETLRSENARLKDAVEVWEGDLQTYEREFDAYFGRLRDVLWSSDDPERPDESADLTHAELWERALKQLHAVMMDGCNIIAAKQDELDTIALERDAAVKAGEEMRDEAEKLRAERDLLREENAKLRTEVHEHEDRQVLDGKVNVDTARDEKLAEQVASALWLEDQHTLRQVP